MKKGIFDVKKYAWMMVAAFISFASTVSVSAQAYTVSEGYDKPAKLKNGGNKPGDFYAKRLQYPIKAILDGVEGTAEIDVGINASGVVESVEIRRSLSPEIDNALRQVAFQEGKWRPAQANRHPVASVQRIVVNLRMTESQRDFSNAMKPFRESGKYPLYVIDGKLVNDYVELEQYQIKSVRVLKGQNAVKLYGEAGNDGVVEITTKRGTPPIW